ncbi:MAG: histidine--tRNA ligase [Caldithrix sp.]|nr:histidine--tRNA ligase [Caldithrix sp.]
MIKRIKGTHDLLPEDSREWVALEDLIRQIMDKYNFYELRTPVFENTELFARGIGQLTDIVSKEMYTFLDRGKKQITLKPEMTAPIIRAYLENKLYAKSQINKIYYIAPLFRQENPQAGRLRQFHQFGAETIGTAAPEADAEMIDLAMTVYDRFGLKGLQLTINSVGDPQCRDPYKKTLQDYIRPHLHEYCPDCQRRFDENPMRILDCKNEACRTLNQQAPKIVDNLCDDCQAHYDRLRDVLQAMGRQYEEDAYLVRGLDYYTRTVFEITSPALGAQNAICGGGRYDLLAEELGGPSTPAIGFASGIERLMMVAAEQVIRLVKEPRLDIFFATVDDAARHKAPEFLQWLRGNGFKCEMDFLQRSIKAQMREANRQNARFVLILGEQELEDDVLSVKIMEQGQQQVVARKELIPFLNQRM